MKDSLPKIAFLVSLAALGYLYGYHSHRWQFFPAKWMAKAEQSFWALRYKYFPADELAFQYQRTEQAERIVKHRPEAMAPGLTLITRVGEKNALMAEVIDVDGTVVHRWNLDWFDLWPEPTHLPDNLKPKDPPGTHIHGAVLMENGDLIFNYDQLGLARVDIHSRVVWRLPQRAHHSIYRAENGNLWIPNMVTRREPLESLTYYHPPFEDYTVIEVDPDDGSVLREISMFELFKKNDLHGFLYLSSLALHPESRGDTLHQNDFELFPEDLEPGFFGPGDAMVSLRNINCVIVFDLETLEKKFVSIGPYVRQHDPDFIDGDTISIFDNNDSAPKESGVQSRILLQKAPSGEFTVAYTGTPENPFFTDLLGKHEWQENGNLLIADSRPGRIFEVDPDGELLWEYFNIVEEGVVGMVEDAQRLPARFDAAFFEQMRAQTADAASAENDKP